MAALLAAGCGGEGGLREYHSAEGRFSVRVPGTPRPDREEQVRKGLVKMSVVERSGNFSVAYEDLPDGSAGAPEEFLEQACDGAVRAIDGRLVSKEEIRLGGHPGRELVIEWAEGRRVVRYRLYLVGHRVHHLTVAGEKWWVESSPADKFFDSFTLLDE